MNEKLRLWVLSFLAVLAVAVGVWLFWSGINQLKAVPSNPVASISSSPSDLFLEKQVSSGSAYLGIDGEKTRVVRVVDGDTIVVEGERTVRLVGVDTPETVDPRRPVGCFGKEASNETKSLLAGKQVILQKDISDKDKYGRLLRYVYLPTEGSQILFVNDYLVREGFAKVMTYPPDIKYDPKFREAEKQAKDARLGMWGKCQN